VTLTRRDLFGRSAVWAGPFAVALLDLPAGLRYGPVARARDPLVGRDGLVLGRTDAIGTVGDGRDVTGPFDRLHRQR
jgi:hypothetical protein